MDPATKTMSEMTFEEWQSLDRYVQWNVMRNLQAEVEELREFRAAVATEVLFSSRTAEESELVIAQLIGEYGGHPKELEG